MRPAAGRDDSKAAGSINGMESLRVAASDMAGLGELLQGHPGVILGSGSPAAGQALEFWQGDWHRAVGIGKTQGPRGLVELMDNNPMVCADSMSVPDPSATLALIAVGPLVRAGLLVEAPTLMYTFAPDPDLVDSYLATEGWTEGATVAEVTQEMGSVLALRAICAVRTEGDPLGVNPFGEIDDLYEEAYGRSFFVRRDETSTWDTALVAGTPYAAFRLSISPDTPYSLLTIQVLADRDGKCGAAQVVHAMNVMAGFEESLGCTRELAGQR